MVYNVVATIIRAASVAASIGVAFPAVGNATYLLSDSEMDQVAAGYNLNGVWTATDGGTYYVRQTVVGLFNFSNEGQVYWFGEGGHFANIAYGNTSQLVAPNDLDVTFAGVPKNGDVLGTGRLSLHIINDNSFTATDKNRVFGGTAVTTFTRKL